MDAHPVPKNVLTVEFKLFGGLTVKQFMKILVACLIALALFFVVPINKIIAVALGVPIVAIGVLSALVPDMGVRITGLFRAIFVSPRYVWRKKAEEVVYLQDQKLTVEEKKEKQKQQASAATSSLDISLDRLLELRKRAKGEDTAQTGAPVDNFARVYRDEFGSAATNRAATGNPVPQTSTNLASNVPTGDQLPIGAGMQVQVRKVSNSQPRAATGQLAGQSSAPPAAPLNTDVQNLATQLSSSIKSGDAETKAQVSAQIDEIYSQIKPAQQSAKSNTRMLLGVIVDKPGNPLPAASIHFCDGDGQEIAVTHSAPDGKFAIAGDIPPGEYIVKVDAPGHKFHDFRLNLKDGKLPAYKFRSV